MTTSDHDVSLLGPESDPDEHIPDLVQEELVMQALPWLDEVAATIRWQLQNRVPLDDLRSIGHFALADLARRYDPEVAPFEPYMRLHLRWAMLDGIRRQRHTRAINARARALVASERLAQVRQGDAGGLPASLEMPPSENTFTNRLRVVMRDHAAAMGISLIAAHGQDFATAPSSAQPERAVFKRARFDELRAAVSELPDPKMRQVIERHYFKGRPLSEVARELKISKGWTSRLHAQAIRLLGARLRGTEADPASSSR